MGILALVIGGCSGKSGIELLKPTESPVMEGLTESVNFKVIDGRVSKTYSISSMRDRMLKAEYAIINNVKDTAAGKQALDDAEKRKLLENYANMGINFSNSACSLWFDELYMKDKLIQYRKNGLNIVGDTAVAVMGAVSSSSKAVSAVGALLGASNTAYENYGASFLLPSATIHKIQDMIRESRVESATIVKAKVASTDSIEVVKDVLLEYHNLCSGQKVVNLLDKSLDFARYTFGDDTLTKPDKSRISDLSGQLYKMVFDEDGEFSRADLTHLFILTSLDSLPNSTANKDRYVALVAGSSLVNSAIATFKKEWKAKMDPVTLPGPPPTVVVTQAEADQNKKNYSKFQSMLSAIASILKLNENYSQFLANAKIKVKADDDVATARSTAGAALLAGADPGKLEEQAVAAEKRAENAFQAVYKAISTQGYINSQSVTPELTVKSE